jgi:serine/threonine-protein kinase
LALGTLGTAYRANDDTGRAVALKVLPPEIAASIAARDRFQREAHRARKARSPHLVNVLDFGDASGTWYLALELVEGNSLAEHVGTHGPLDAGVAREVLVQAAQAMAVLHREGVMPRDLSAGNFIVTGGPDDDGRITVKLCDLGLLRSPDDDSSADVRAALAALGGTIWFLLSGRADEAPDVGSLGDDVPYEFRNVLWRLVARRPEERYPTPAALLEALGEEEPSGKEEPVESAAPELAAAVDEADVVDPVAALAVGEEEEPPRPRKAPAGRKPMRRRDDPDEAEEKPSSTRKPEPAEDEPATEPTHASSRKGLILGAAAVGGVLMLGILIAALALHGSDAPPKRPPVTRGPGPIGNGTPPQTSEKSEPTEPKKPIEPEKGPEPPPTSVAGLPALYAPNVPLDREKLAQEFSPPSEGAPQVPADAPVFRVARMPPAGADAARFFDSIASACAAVPEGKWGVVEVADNGPLMEGPITVSGRNVQIRAARGFAPLVVWDAARERTELRPGKPPSAPPPGEPPAFLSVDKGTLLLDNIHMAVRWPEHLAGSPCLVRVTGGDLRATESTFSVAGKPDGTCTAVRFNGGAGRSCRLVRCCARGARLTALDVPTAGADVTIDGSLLVGGEAPVLAVAAGASSKTACTLRVIRSTLVGRDSLLRVKSSPEQPTAPALRWLGWDALLWRSGDTTGGTLVDLPSAAETREMKWRAVNCLYAGWQTLLTGQDPVRGPDVDAWHQRWEMVEGDVSQPLAWAKSLPADPAEAAPSVYRTDPGPLGYAASSGSGALGCDLSRLPRVRSRWIDLTAERALPGDLATLVTETPPPIPAATDALYHGERIDLDQTDPGAYLRDVQKARKLAPTVVLHLHGTGTRRTSPIVVENASLVLYFEPSAEGAAPLVLEPDPTVPPGGHALFEVTHGNLSLIGGDVRCPDFKTALLPAYVVSVKEGSLSLDGTRLQGPVTQPPPGYTGLVRVEGTGSAARGTYNSASIDRCVLLSAGSVLDLARAGVRADVKQSLIVAADRAVGLRGDAPEKDGAAHLNVEFTADHTTFAAREAVFSLAGAEPRSVVADPVLVQTKDCAFLNPYAENDGAAAPAVLLAYRDGSLQRGELCWQAVGNVYDQRLHAYAAAAGADGKPVRPDPPQAYAIWERIWGSAERRPILDVPLKATLNLQKPALDRLALPAHPSLKAKPGADIARLLPGPRKPR